MGGFNIEEGEIYLSHEPRRKNDMSDVGNWRIMFALVRINIGYYSSNSVKLV